MQKLNAKKSCEGGSLSTGMSRSPWWNIMKQFFVCLQFAFIFFFPLIVSCVVCVFFCIRLKPPALNRILENVEAGLLGLFWNFCISSIGAKTHSALRTVRTGNNTFFLLRNEKNNPPDGHVAKMILFQTFVCVFWCYKMPLRNIQSVSLLL